MTGTSAPLATAVAIAPGGAIGRAATSEFVGALVDSVIEVDRMIARFTALKAELVDTARQAAGYPSLHPSVGADSRAGASARSTDLARRSFRAEIATALRIPERSAETLIAVSELLTHALPHTLEALKAGTIGYAHAQRIADAAATLSDAGTTQQLELVAVPVAERTTPATLARKLRPIREKLQPESIAERHTRALDDREVLMDSAADGMAWLTAFLPIVDVTAIYNRLSDSARALRDGTENRTLAQLRADVLRDVLLDDESGCTGCVGAAPGTAGSPGAGAAHCRGTADDTGADDNTGTDDKGIVHGGHAPDDSDRTPRERSVSRYRGIRPRVYLTVPVLTLLGHGSEPPTLEGYGPIDTETARELTARAPSLTRVLTHPETGAILSVGRTSYVVPADLRTWLRIRDLTCRFPGCNQRAASCDVDHSVDWQSNGLTAHDNLAHLCRGHHTLKHHGRWRVAHTGDGTLLWTSPAGRRHVTHPENRLPAGSGPPSRSPEPELGSALPDSWPAIQLELNDPPPF